MMIRGQEIATRTIAMVVGVIVLIVLVLGTLTYCQNQRSKGAQTRVDSAQSGAATNSAVDAINTVTGVGGNTAASEDLGRNNERDIRAAEGANTKIGPGVNAAGRAALCKRAAYRNDPACKGVK